MKKILNLLVVMQFVFAAFTVSAFHETTVSHNEKYASAVETALNESEYPENELDFAVEYQMIPADKASELTRSGIFRRSDMVQLVYNSLKTRMKDETLFCEYLMDEGILSENDLKILQ